MSGAPRGANRIALRMLCAIAAGAVALAALVPFTVDRSRSAGAQSSPYSVTAEPTVGLVDGQQVTITVRTDPANPVYEARAYVCRANVTYLPSDGDVPRSESQPGGPHCPPTGVSTSAQPIALAANPFKFAPTPEGVSFSLRVGVGVVEWPSSEGGTARLACDVTNPCVLLVQLYVGNAWLPVPFELTFKTADAAQSCGGSAPGALTSAGSDALADAWIDWTLATCASKGTGAWSRLSLGEESQAVKRFAEGSLDIAYSALGYNEQAGFVADVPNPRPAVAVPVAVTAPALALGNGWLDADGRKRPYGTASITLDEATVLLGGGEFAVRQYEGAIGARNPQLSGGGFMIVSDRIPKVAAPAEAGITPFALTRHLDTLRPDLWRVPDLPLFPDAGQPRGVDVSFPLAAPSYANVLTTLTGRPALAKALSSLPFEPGAMWIFTDATTAETFDLAPVAIENAAGDFVAPTREAMTAAVASMDVTADGMRLPNPSSTTGYPLTYVVYAMVPAQPLTDASGACRTESQALLAEWLTYVTGEGQANLPAGMAPLTSELQAEAAEALQRVGQTPGAPCPVPPIGGGAPTPVPPSASPGGLVAGTGRAPSPGRARASLAAAAGADAVEQANAELAASDADAPGFLGGALPSLLAALAALLGVGGLTAYTAKQTSKRALGSAPDGPVVSLTIEDPSPP